MKVKSAYLSIDMKKTGSKLKRLIKAAGYTPRMLQNILQLSCPQPIYRWYKGVVLPSVDHLFTMSELLGVHMEELLERKGFVTAEGNMDYWEKQEDMDRFIVYYTRIRRKWLTILD